MTPLIEYRITRNTQPTQEFNQDRKSHIYIQFFYVFIAY